jgi:hypothetical protein
LAFYLCGFVVFFIYVMETFELSLRVQFFYNMMGPWITVANPIVTIWINHPYREAAKQLLTRTLLRCCKRETNNATTKVTPIVPTPMVVQPAAVPN